MSSSRRETMLKRFLNPRWQHPDHDVRRRAVEALAPGTDDEAIAQVAREDALPALRRLALRATMDLDLLEERAAQDDDESVREQAVRRHRELLAGQVATGPPLTERLARAEASTDAALIEYLVREGRDEALRVTALARVERETVLRDVALGDSSPELRLEALARIEDENVLARVQERSRKTDKHVHHAAKERLEAIREARERPQRVAAESESICATLEELGNDGHWERDAKRLETLEQRWEALDTKLRQPFEARHAQARQRFLDGLTAFRAATAAARAEREALIARLRALSGAPDEGERDTLDAWIQARQAALRDVRRTWKEGAPLAEEDRSELEALLEEAEGGLRDTMDREQRRQALSRLLDEHQRLSKQKGVIAESEVKDLERAMAALPQPAVQDAGLADLGRRVDRIHQQLRDRVREQAGWKHDVLTGLPGRLDALKKAVTDGHASDAITLHDALAADLDALHAAGTSDDRLAKTRKRLAALGKDVKVMRAWGRFGARAAAERLCEQMEALEGTDQPPPEIARQVREARSAWKDLARGGQGVDQSLWRRFDKAATEAYLPCKTYFAERAGARQANVEKRRALLDELERFLAENSGGPDMDWKGAVRFRRDLLKRWHEAHPVERGPGKALAVSLDEHLSRLDDLLGRERERSLRQREQLIKDAEALGTSEDKKAAAEACKRLQAQWRVTVPGKRGEENALWERFRSACDAVFGERQQVFDAERASVKETLGQREALCQRVEALADTDAGSLDEAERELHRAEGEWNRSAPMPRREGEALQKRFTAAVRGFRKHQRTLQAQRRREALDLMRAKAALCDEAERLVMDATGVETVDALQTRWHTLDALPDSGDEAAMMQRFEAAMAGAVNSSQAWDAAALEANRARRESICLRLEILSGVDSPPEHAAARMAMQVQRLANALGDGERGAAEKPEALLREWCTTGPAPGEQAGGLEARFERAWSAHTTGAQGD